MILRIFALACAVFTIPSTVALLTTNEFSKKFEDMCFQNDDKDPFRINGQDIPHSNTLENFIALVEKLEAANPHMDLKDELYYFVRNYVYENINLITSGVNKWKPENSVSTNLEKILQYEGLRELTIRDDIFTNDEKCSLYYMISHSIVEKRKEPKAQRAFEYNNSSRDYRTDLNPDEYYPQEIGVVAIRGSILAVSLSKVLIGMYVGLLKERQRDISTFDLTNGFDEMPLETNVDTLYTLTILDVIMMAGWVHSSRKGYATNGEWVSIPMEDGSKINGFCPMVYKQSDATYAYSYSSVRGAADGLILGSIIKSIHDKKSDARLSTILRMYYSRDGIGIGNVNGVNNLPSEISFCNRHELLSNLESSVNIDLKNQMQLYAQLTAEKSKDLAKLVDEALLTYTDAKQQIFSMDSAPEIVQYCRTPVALANPYEWPKQTSLDILVVLDSRFGVDLFRQQQLITGYFASFMDLRYSGSRMTILQDIRINSGSGSGRIDLKPIIIDTYSSSCAACEIAQITYQQSDLDRDQVIVAIDQLLAEKAENETKMNAANGKVVLYFDFSPDTPRDNNKIQGRLDKALRDLLLRHLDTALYAVGLNVEVLKKFARDDPAFIFLAADGKEKTVAEKLFTEISFTPGFLQYPECEDGRNEASAVYENYVSPTTIQHWVMPAKYFYKSRSLKVMFESQNAIIKVCHSRATDRPENEAKNCNDTEHINRIEFKLTNPCQGFNQVTCSPFYFAVMGIKNTKTATNGMQKDYCNENNGEWCPTLDAIKFKVLHDGIRCSGCLGLGAMPSVLFITLLLTYFIHKNL